MSMVKTVVSRPTTFFIIFALLIGLGIFAMTNLPIDLYPEISLPIMAVYTIYPGAGPEEVERSVTRLLEATLSSVSGMDTINSISSKGLSLLIMQFTYGTDLAEATNSIRDYLDRIRNYFPDGIQSPIIFKADPSMMPIMTFMVTSEKRTSEELREIAEDTIVPRIEQTPGISTASVNGGREKIVRVEIPQSRLEAYGLTITSIQQMLAIQNMQTAAGSITDGGISYLLTTMGEYSSLDEIKNTVINYKPGYAAGQVEMRQIYLRDIADVFEGYKNESNVVYVNGQSAVTLSVSKQTGKNSVQTAKELRERMKKLTRELPTDLKVTELFNTTDIIENSLNQVTSTAMWGAILAIVTLFIFLRSGKPTIIIGLSIPISVIITMLLMYFAGLTLNLMTMAGLVLGIGMLIDNSIVILENIYHYREKGAKLKTASVLGTSEMIVAITASTLTTICVFAPMIMFQGLLEMAGELFSGLAFTVVISLGISLFTAIFLVPVLSSHYLPIVTRKQVPLKGALAVIDAKIGGFFVWLDTKYRNAVRRILNRKLIVILILAALLGVSIFLIPIIGWELMPQQESDNVNITATLPIGTTLQETEAVLKQLQLIVEREIAGNYDRLTLNAGGGGIMTLGASTSHSGSLRIGLPEYSVRKMDANEIQTILEPYLNQFPGVIFSFSGGGFGMNMLGGSSVSIILRTDDLVKGKAIAQRISDLLKERLNDYVTEPSIDLTDGLPQYEIIIDREKMYALGLNTYQVGNEIKAAVDGVTATRYKSGGKDYDVLLILAEADRSNLPALDHIFISSQMSGRVPLSNFVSYQQGTGPMSINREDQSRVINITARARPGVRTNHLQEMVENLIRSEIPVEDDVTIEYGGANTQMVRMMGRFILICIVAVFLVFGIMASLFESFRAPFIIILTIPLSVIGIVAIYLITNTIFNMLTAVGLLVLIGIITNNGIILVDYTNLLRKRGYALNDAIIEAARSRLRPILMTTVTTVLGLVPMAFFPGEGTELVAPIGKTVLGGLSFGTLMTLFLMPVMYAIINKNSDIRAAKAQEKRDKIAAGEGRVKQRVLQEQQEQISTNTEVSQS